MATRRRGSMRLGTLIQLGPGGREPNVSWEAFPLPVARPGQPHVVEVEYPTDVPQTMGISIVEPNAAGNVTPIGLDSGVYLPDDAIGGEPRMAKHRVIFWPRTKTPLLLITNQRDGSRAVFGKVRVIGPKASVVSNLGRDAGRPAYLPRGLRGRALRRGIDCWPATTIVRCFPRTFRPARPSTSGAAAAWTTGSRSTKAPRGWSSICSTSATTAW